METGLSQASVLSLQRTHGKNKISVSSSTSLVSLFFSQFTTLINGILLSGAILAYAVGETLDTVFILVIIVLNGIIGFVQEYNAEKAVEKLKSYAVQVVRVIRDGKEAEIDSEDLVPGDIVVLSEGDRIPADGVLTTSHHMENDESILTGESLPVLKETGHEVYLGMLVTKGKGLMKVTSIGLSTKFGKIAKTLTSIHTDPTPLQKQLTVLGRYLSLFSVSSAGILVLLSLWKGQPVHEALLLAASVAIATIPEGLPAIITIALALGALKMAQKKSIVRKMSSIETLGSIQIILSDKTGTLTQNKMVVKTHWLAGKDTLSDLLTACVLGNTASYVKTGDGREEMIGDKTDGALLKFAHEQLPTHHERIKEGLVIDEFVFDSERKTISTVWEHSQKRAVYVRGAPEMILENSKTSEKEKEEILSQITSYAQKGYRVIGFAYKPITTNENYTRESLESDVLFLGIVGIYDPPRVEAKEAVETAIKAGIIPIMVTGDNEVTAASIAKELGILENDQDVLTGETLAKMSDADLLEILPRVRVFSRAQPEDKLRLTTLLQQKGYVVGVTGDGVNDSLALKKANVGVAMGQTGTDVAKEASDIIVTDDNFATIINAVGEGRTIYRNIVKSITYLLSGNLSELGLIFFGTLVGMPSPLLPTQILWINIVTDGLPALALASDKRPGDILSEKPRNPKEQILSRSRLQFIFGIGGGLTILLLFVFWTLLKITSEGIARTIVFNLLIFSHLTVSILIRGQSIFKLNRLHIVTILLTIALQILITFTPFFQEIFRLELPF